MSRVPDASKFRSPPHVFTRPQRMLREALDAFVVQDIGAAHAILEQDDLLDAVSY